MFCPRCASEVAEDKKLCPSCGMDISAITEITKDKATEQPDELALVKDALGSEYEILGELGRGGMAVVYKALDKNLDRVVAVKVLPLSMAYDNEFVERFQREAKTAAKLEHPNVIPIYRVGKTGRIIYFVMKYLRGKSLGDIIDEKGPLAPSDIRRILAESADALGYAHENEVVHRDIKPDNIVFDEKGRAIVTDFGIAKAASGSKLTGTGMAIGTPYYMSPEQARAQKLDGRSDIYSLGVVAFQSLTGHVPFEGDDSFAVGIKHISQELPKPDLATEAQRDLFTIIEKMLAKAPEDRFQNTDELIKALKGGPTTAATQAMAASDPSFAPVRASTPTTPMPNMGINDSAAKKAAKKKMSPAVMAAVTGLVVIVGGSAVFFSNRSATEDPPQTESETPVAANHADATDTAAPDGTEAPKAGDGVASVADTADTQVTAAVDEHQAREANEEAVAAEATPEVEEATAGEPSTPAQPQLSAVEVAWRAELREGVDRIIRNAADQAAGFEPVGQPISRRLGNGERFDHTIRLRGGREYLLIGLCDADCGDLNLAIFGPDGEEIAADYDADANPILQFVTTGQAQPQAYRVRARMRRCSASGCRYGFGILSRDPQQRGDRRRGRKGQ